MLPPLKTNNFARIYKNLKEKRRKCSTLLNVLHLYKRFLEPKNSKKFRYLLQFLFPTLIRRDFYNTDFYLRNMTINMNFK